MRVPRPGSDRIVKWPPSASTRSRNRSSPASEPALFAHRDGRPRVGAGALERLETAEVDRSQDLGRAARGRLEFDGDGNADARSRGAQSCGEASRL